jgi:SAM-dependent methyltransferase
VRQQLVRVGPVHFQPLEEELEPVAAYLTGHMLDAGCGTRDIASYMRGKGVVRITRYDLESTDPDVVLGPLEAMPFSDASFDAALCNAVLEHVGDADRAIRELARVVRPGGHIVVAVPFLQPYHACPGDYRRFTADGLAQLGRAAGLEEVVILPVHSFAQTIGWMLWEYAQEKGGRLRRWAAWAIAYLATRVSYRTDDTLRRNANTFQAVFRRPLNRGDGAIGDWLGHELPEAATSVPTMLMADELRLLHHLAEEHVSGVDAVVDCGCFLGGSTVALADGLRRNLTRRAQTERRLIHVYDRFLVEDWTRGAFFPESTPTGASFRDRFDRNVAPYAELLEVHEGDVEAQRWTGGPIELLFVDIAKHWTTCDWVTRELFPHLIPGRSIVVQQDYLYERWTGWLHVTMEFYADYFEYVCDTGLNSVVFRYTKPIPPEVLRPHTVESLSIEQNAALMDRAAERFPPAQREVLRAAKRQFVEMLSEA